MNYSYDKKPFPISRFFIKIMLIIVIVFLSIWLYSKYKVNKEIDTNELTKEQVFSNNLEKVKNAALKYYDLDTVNKLTSNNDKVTLKVLIDKKYIKKLKDYDNKSCNINKTYALLTKIDDYYKMKVNLNCQGVKDYISLTLKPNLNCKTYLCDASKEIKKDEEVEEVEVMII